VKILHGYCQAQELCGIEYFKLVFLNMRPHGQFLLAWSQISLNTFINTLNYMCDFILFSKIQSHILIVETQWEKPDTLQQATVSEQTTASSEEHTAYQQASNTSEGDSVTAGVKRSSGDDDSSADGGSEIKRPYSGRGYCRGGAYGSWTVVAER